MSHPLISVAELQALLRTQAAVRLFDCTGDLMKPENGPIQYREQHIVGARYADLNHCLSAHGDLPKIDRKSTRLNSSHSQQSRMPSSA